MRRESCGLNLVKFGLVSVRFKENDGLLDYRTAADAPLFSYFPEGLNHVLIEGYADGELPMVS